VIPYNPIAGGLLSGKHDGAAPPPDGTRFSLRNAGARYQARYWHEQEFATIESLRSVAQEAGMTMAALAVAWVLSNSAITAPIVGASRPEQLADSLAAADMNGLSPELKARLDELTHGWRAVDAERWHCIANGADHGGQGISGHA
jgi:aryl-alcohol dehydrogenase-like predicted oxidoreductase